jgi:hypothetical protein
MSVTASPFSPKKSNDNLDRNKENWTPKRLVFSQKPDGASKPSPMKNSTHNKENTPNRSNCEPRKNATNPPLSHQKQVSNTYTRSTLTANVSYSPNSKKSPSKRTPSKAKPLPLSPLKGSPSKRLKSKQQPSALAVFTWLPFAVKFLTYKQKKTLVNVEQVVEHEQCMDYYLQSELCVNCLVAFKKKINELESRLQDQTMLLIEKDERLDTVCCFLFRNPIEM